MSVVRRRVVVEGDVQGVFFRDECRKAAQRAGVAGSARNRSDGRVEVVLEGDEAAVERMVDWCRRGSSRSEVTGTEVSEEEPEGLSGFDTR
ncbi:MAG TPA: acylphosphatase [Acidimicrobiales bacterium]|nr:acylphosphatase [Acidimicrobiales bacterium]